MSTHIVIRWARSSDGCRGGFGGPGGVPRPLPAAEWFEETDD